MTPYTPSEAEIEAALDAYYGRGDWKSFFFPNTAILYGAKSPSSRWEEKAVERERQGMCAALIAAFACRDAALANKE